MKNIHDMSPGELRRHIEQLRRVRDELLRQIDDDGEQDAEQPEPEPEPALRLPTKKMRRAVERFDRLTDDEQADHLRGLF